MRFALVLLLFSLAAPLASAAPGDKYDDETKWSERPAARRQPTSNDKPFAPTGFAVSKTASNLGGIVALAVIDDDLFIADAAQERILRLKSRNANSVFETRAEFLVGFTHIQDLATDSNWLYMADSTGIWKIDPGTSLVATKAPDLLYTYGAAQKNTPVSIAIHPNGNTIVVGAGSCVTAVNMQTASTNNVACGKWQIQDVAISPNGGIWASVKENGASYILPMRDEAVSSGRLKLPSDTEVRHMHFWQSKKYPDSWPKEWAGDLIFSLTGNQPMLARAHFNFGDIAPEFMSFIDGFSKPSRFVGGRDYWGVPTAMAVLSNGQMVFVEGEQGTLWTLKKDAESETTSQPLLEKKELNEISPPPDDKKKPPTLPRGSSISSASGLETDELLKRPEILDRKKEEE